MKAEEKVKKMFPDAFCDDGNWGRYTPRFRVTIKPGRYAYGRMRSWAWVDALESIQQDDELSLEALRVVEPKAEPSKSLNPLLGVQSEKEK